MTTTGESARPRPLIGQVVGQAQASLTRLLTGILARSGLSHQVWLGLQRLSAMGGQPARAAYEADLSYWLQLDGAAAVRTSLVRSRRNASCAASMMVRSASPVPCRAASVPGRFCVVIGFPP